MFTQRSHRMSATGVLVMLMGAAVAGCDADSRVDEPDDAAMSNRPIVWAEVESARSGTSRRIAGVVRSVERAPLSFEVPGRVEAVHVGVGDEFESGDVLAELDDRTFRLTLAQRRAELSEARANLTLAKADYRRAERLLGRGAISQAKYDAAQSSFETASSRVDVAASRVDLAREDLADAKLHAPYDGAVAARLIEPAQRVRAGATAVEVQSVGGGLEVHVVVPESLVTALAPGSEHRVTLPEVEGELLTGSVTEVGVDAEYRSAYPVTLELVDPPQSVRAGMTAEVRLHLDATGPERVAIPATAFLAGDGEREFAFVFDERSRTVSRREIDVTDVSGGRALVASGLERGEIVASKGVAFLSDGQRVTRVGVGVKRYSP